MVRPQHRHHRRLQPRRHRLGPRLHRPRLDHDSRRRLLLLWSPPPQECPQHDLDVHDDPCCRLISGEHISFLAPAFSTTTLSARYTRLRLALSRVYASYPLHPGRATRTPLRGHVLTAFTVQTCAAPSAGLAQGPATLHPSREPLSSQLASPCPSQLSRMNHSSSPQRPSTYLMPRLTH